jgi:enoyl-CoA hydratase/carnithine racemase
MQPSPFVVSIEKSGPHAGIATLKLDAGSRPVVVLDELLVRRLQRTLSTLPRAINGLVLASATERAFVAGADLKAIMALSEAQLHRYLAFASEVYGMLCWLPYPTVAAINGAALGGGLELAMHCDALVGAPGAKPYAVGLPEAGLCICPGWGGTSLLAARIDASDAITRTATGKPFMFDEAVAAKLFDDVAKDAASLLPACRGWIAQRNLQGRIYRDGAPSRHAGRTNVAAKVITGLDSVRASVTKTPAGAAVAACVDAAVTKGWSACLQNEQANLVRLRNTPAAKEAIEAFFAKSKK